MPIPRQEERSFLTLFAHLFTRQYQNFRFPKKTASDEKTILPAVSMLKFYVIMLGRWLKDLFGNQTSSNTDALTIRVTDSYRDNTEVFVRIFF